jgi:hypothetical protein
VTEGGLELLQENEGDAEKRIFRPVQALCCLVHDKEEDYQNARTVLSEQTVRREMNVPLPLNGSAS